MRKQKMIRWLAWAVAGIACVAGGIHVYQKYQEREAAIRAIEARDQAKSQEEEDLANGILTWNGKKYRRNTAMRAILCIGVDTKGEMEAQDVAGKGGDADALFLVAQDAAKDEAQIVLIPRNTMTEIEVFDYFGNPIGTETKQLTLAYAFGDGREKSCELTVGALSKLLFGLQIDGYFAVNMDSIPYFNDAVGGVPITVEDDMVADLHQFFHIFFFVCRCKDMIFFSHLFISKSCLIQSARCCSADILTDHRIQAVHRKCFLGEQDVTAALLLKIRKNLQIFSDFAFIHNIARCRQIFPHHSTVCGFSSTTHGSPY